MIEVSGLTKRFGPSLVLDGVDLQVQRGEVVAVLGRSGGGKSTMLRCINLLETPEAGIVRAAGHTLFDGGKAASRSALIAARRDRSHPPAGAPMLWLTRPATHCCTPGAPSEFAVPEAGPLSTMHRSIALAAGTFFAFGLKNPRLPPILAFFARTGKLRESSAEPKPDARAVFWRDIEWRMQGHNVRADA